MNARRPDPRGPSEQCESCGHVVPPTAIVALLRDPSLQAAMSVQWRSTILLCDDCIVAAYWLVETHPNVREALELASVVEAVGNVADALTAPPRKPYEAPTLRKMQGPRTTDRACEHCGAPVGKTCSEWLSAKRDDHEKTRN